VVLTFLSLLLLFLGGLLDGLYLSSTGAVRAQSVDTIVYSADARSSFLRSRVDAALAAEVANAPGVGEVGELGVALLGSAAPNGDLLDTAVIGYEIAPRGVPATPPAGQAYADNVLADRGVELGDQLLVGPAQSPLTVIGFVDDTNYLGQGGLWVALPTWREIQNANRPDAAVTDDMAQVLVVRGSASPANIDQATGGATSSLTVGDAVLALPGIKEQDATFSQIIYSTLAVVLAIVGLFFSLLTIERTGLYGVLKAIGSSTRQLFAGVALQAVVVTIIAFVAGSLLALLAAALLPADVPLQLVPNRFVTTFVGMLVAALLGSALSLRRVIRIDPATAIGSST
jgi:putative ABC transport system permease protein